jgi:hypothetical protein
VRRISVILLVDPQGGCCSRSATSTRRSPRRSGGWWAGTSLTDADIVLGEGRRIVFVAPEDFPALDASDSCAHFVSRFLGSRTHRDLAREAAAAEE